MRTENLAIVFVDIAGFTPRTSAQTRDETLRMLKRFDGIVRPLVRAYRGQVIKTIGDAYLLTFRSPTDALLCSMAVHDRIAETDAAADPCERFSIRAAVNAGDVRMEGSDIFGEAVNIASRIEGKAGPGEIYFSESVFLSMTRSEVPSEEVGYTELKGIADKVRLYRVPRTSELPRGDNSPAASGGLPFGGRGLDRVRDRLGSPLSTDALAPAVEHARGLLEKAGDLALRGFSWWQIEVRRSRTVQIATIAAMIALAALLIWALTPRQTPMQKFRRSLGF
ncbi:MAG: adenylate/guanylate cyclase domain-containing protein [Nitrospirota bacterium]